MGVDEFTLNLEFVGFPDLKPIIGGTKIVVNSQCKTFGDALAYLKETYGESIDKAILDDQGHIDQTVQIIRNEKEWIERDDFSAKLYNGDKIAFILMVSGG